jgi:hypothetical protein
MSYVGYQPALIRMQMRILVALNQVSITVNFFALHDNYGVFLTQKSYNCTPILSSPKFLHRELTHCSTSNSRQDVGLGEKNDWRDAVEGTHSQYS